MRITLLAATLAAARDAFERVDLREEPAPAPVWASSRRRNSYRQAASLAAKTPG